MRRLSTALLALALTACTRGEAQGGGAPGGRPPAPVAVAPIRAGDIVVEQAFLGQVRALRRATLAAGAPGEVRSVEVREGDRVTAGALLVDVDRSVASAQLRAAQAAAQQASAEAEQARRDAERLARAGSQLVAESDIERAGARVEALEARGRGLSASEREARSRIGMHRVEAPFDGFVARRLVDPGDWVDPGDAVLELVDDSGVEILCSVPPSVLAEVTEGTSARLVTGAETIDAEVRGVVRALDESTRTGRLRVVPLTRSPALLPGATVDVVLTLTRRADGAVVVPRDALVYGAVGHRVVRVVDGKAQPVRVEVVASSDSEALVRGEGLAADQPVVVRGNERLRPDQEVSVGPAGAAAPGTP